MNDTNEIPTEPSLERRTRRRFSASDKQRLLAEYDALPRGEKGGWLRRNALYAGQLAEWRRTLSEAGTQGLEPKSGGPKLPRTWWICKKSFWRCSRTHRASHRNEASRAATGRAATPPRL